eukprot:15480-Amphidinium_carterae.1
MYLRQQEELHLFWEPACSMPEMDFSASFRQLLKSQGVADEETPQVVAPQIDCKKVADAAHK